MKCGELVRSRKFKMGAASCAVRFLLTLALTKSVWFHTYAPFGLGLIAAAGPGYPGFFALMGAAAGALLFMEFAGGLRYLAAGLLLYTANNAFYDAKFYSRKWVPPLLSVGLCIAVEFVYILQSGIMQLMPCLLAVLCTGVCTVGFRPVLGQQDEPELYRRISALLLIIGLLCAAATFSLPRGFIPAHILALLCVMYIAYEHSTSSAVAAALCIGLSMDIVLGQGDFLYSAVYSFGALGMNLRHRGRRSVAVLLFCLPVLLLLLPLPIDRALPLLYETLLAALAFLLLPARVFHGKRANRNKRAALAREVGERSDVQRKLEQSAAAFRDLYDSATRVPEGKEENPAVIFDRTAEAVCKDCTLCRLCWSKEYDRTYAAFNEAAPKIIERGQGRGDDFPSGFTDRCIRFSSFLVSLNSELSAFLLRRQYRSRLSETRAQAAGQYEQLSELLDATAGSISRAIPATAVQTLLSYRIGMAMDAKAGEQISGDSVHYFETDDAMLILTLSDGMGCGENARKESAMTVRLLERFLRAGIDAAPTLKTVNNALTLRAECSDSFTTIDLMKLSLRSGEAEVYKYGAAPSYVKKNGRVNRISCHCLPAGLHSSSEPPEMTELRLEGASYFVMVTDGVADSNDDEWIQNLLAGWERDDPQLLAESILIESRKRRGGDDDGGVLVLYISPDFSPAAREL